ncbi:MAG: Na+/H+ antiporter NhaC family protein [Hellea sp.]
MENYGLISLLPPVIAIGLALWTRQVFLSLLIGIASGFLVLAGGNPLQGLIGTMAGFVRVFESNYNTEIIIFTLLIGALIALIQRAGGVEGFVNRVLSWLQRKAANADTKGQRKRVELLAVLTGMLIFVESNISTLTVGTLYRPVTDKLSIPREKLAYIADSTCAPACILIPLNAWGAYIIGLLNEQSVEEPVSMLVSAIAFNFYPMLAILLLVIVILTGRDIGEMKRAETRARTEGKILRDGALPMIAGEITMMTAKEGAVPRARNMLIPLVTLVVLMPIFLVYTGWASGPDASNNFFDIVKNASGSKSVVYAVCGAIIVSVGLNKAQNIMGVREMVDVILKGMSGMLPLALLMVFAFALGDLCGQLGTGTYVAEQAKPYLSPALVPILVFLVSAFIAFSTGTSWGTFAIMIAIAVPLAQGLDTNVSLAVAAALGGGVFGDHCSPTSDTSIITSMATANDHIDHVRTQLPYALIGGAITAVLYLILGLMSV